MATLSVAGGTGGTYLANTSAVFGNSGSGIEPGSLVGGAATSAGAALSDNDTFQADFIATTGTAVTFNLTLSDAGGDRWNLAFNGVDQ
jgi:hypothetical protein